MFEVGHSIMSIAPSAPPAPDAKSETPAAASQPSPCLRGDLSGEALAKPEVSCEASGWYIPPLQGWIGFRWREM